MKLNFINTFFIIIRFSFTCFFYSFHIILFSLVFLDKHLLNCSPYQNSIFMFLQGTLCSTEHTVRAANIFIRQFYYIAFVFFLHLLYSCLDIYVLDAVWNRLFVWRKNKNQIKVQEWEIYVLSFSMNHKIIGPTF